MNSKNEIIIIVDFDNYFKKPIEEYSLREFEYYLKVIIDNAFQSIECAKYNFVSIRLYSGWRENAEYTRKSSETLQKIAGLQLFPITKEGKFLINGKVEIITSLHSIPEFIFEHTYREKKGIQRIRIDKDMMDDVCHDNPEHCPAHILSKFTKKKDRVCTVEGCETNHNEIFFLREQKMVDTMIACDLITFCEDENVNAISLISDDHDHLPAIISGSVRNPNNKKIQLSISNRRHIEYFENILVEFNVSTKLLP